MKRSIKTLASVLVVVLLGVWWVVYFSISKDFSQVWAPCLLVVLFAAPIIKDKYRLIQQSHHHSEWLKAAKASLYRSDKLGLSFLYLTEDEFRGKVSINENGTQIMLSAGNENELLILMPKEKNVSLVDHLTLLHKRDYSLDCHFYPLNSATARLLGFPDRFHVVASGENDETNCPRLRPHSNFAGRDYFFEQKEHPDKVFFISLSKTPFLAQQPPSENSPWPKWFSTLEIH